MGRNHLKEILVRQMDRIPLEVSLERRPVEESWLGIFKKGEWVGNF